MDKLGKKIGAGRSSEVLGYGTNKVLKLFNAGSKYETIKWEYDKLMDAMEKGVPVPAVHGFVERGGRFGFVMDKVKGKPFWDTLIRHVAETGGEENGGMSRLITENVKIIARTLHKLHGVKAELMDTRQKVLARAARYNKIITDDERKAVLSVLDALPNDGTVCHGDPNFDNILIDGENAAYIDWYYMGTGHFMSDLTEFVITARYLYIHPTPSMKRFAVFMGKYAEEMINVLFDEYTRVSGSAITDLDKWLIPSLTNRLNDGGDSKYKAWLLADLRKKLNS
jgi:uncharacterized protein (TIGR02172 family)